MTKGKYAIKVLNLMLIAVLLLNYVIYTPLLHPFHQEGAFIWLGVLSLFLLVNSPKALAGIRFERTPQGQFHLNMDHKAKDFQKLLKIFALLWSAYFIVTLASTPLFVAYRYRDQLGVPTVSDFSDDIQIMDLSQVPIVDKSLAYTLADKKLGENAGMGSQVYLGEPVIQQVNGQLIWVVPLLHSGFFKWLQNNDGSAGYIRVSATNQQDIQFVETPIKYQPNSFFWDDISRYLRTVKGHIFTPMTDYSFEINDNGEPYWIITTYQNHWLFSLPEATGVITLHASTGETTQYTLDNIPDWVDRVQPEEFIVNQINQQGYFVHGILNFSNKDKFMSSREEAIIYNEGNCYLFTGLTSVGADESAIGFIMVDMVTKESKIYQIPGATENRAMRSAEGQVQQFGYFATSPIIINHEGIPTYFITLKDNGGLIKQYAFVSVSDVTTVGAGETISLALRDYNTSLNATNSFVNPTGEEETLVGHIQRIASEMNGVDLTYKFILEEYPQYIFILPWTASPELALTLPEDEVRLRYYETEDSIITAYYFDNLEYNQD